MIAVVGAAPAGADLAEQDAQFLTTLRSIGWKNYDAEVLTTHGQMVCNEGLAHRVSWHEIRRILMSYGYSLVDASLLTYNAVLAYCPERTDVTGDCPEFS